MKKKLLLLIILIVLCAGCKVRYSIEITKDNKVIETVTANETVDFFDNYPNSSTGRVIGFLIEPYLDKLNENNYEIKERINDKSGGVVITKTYDNMEDYIKNTIFKEQFTDKIEYVEKGKKVTISAKGFLSNSEQDQTRFPIEDGIISIKIPFKVTYNNADEVQGDTYIWYPESNKEKEIKIEYNKGKLNGDSNYTVLIVLGLLIIILVVGFISYGIINNRRKNANEL